MTRLRPAARLWRRGLAVLALVFCASLAAPLLGAGGSAQAQDVLVTNVGSATSTDLRLGASTSSSKDGVQVFTTGTSAGGYTLTSILLKLYHRGLATADNVPPAATLHNVTVTSTAVTLGTAVATLTTSASHGTVATIYTPPTGTALAGSTTYGVFVEGGGNHVHWDLGDTGDEDATPAPGWSIGDQVASRAHDATAGFTLGGGPGVITVNGTAKASNTAPTSSEPDLFAVEDTDYSFLRPDFPITDTEGDALASVKIVTLPATGTGTLTLSGTPITTGELPKTVTAPDLAAGSLKYSPPANEATAPGSARTLLCKFHLQGERRLGRQCGGEYGISMWKRWTTAWRRASRGSRARRWRARC